MFTVYILKSQRKDWHYIGSTNDLDRRLKQHNNGHTKSTQKYRPFDLIYTEQHQTKQAASKREWYLKHVKGYKEKLDILRKNSTRSSVG